MAASPHGKKALAAVADLKRIYGVDQDTHAGQQFKETIADPDGAAHR